MKTKKNSTNIEPTKRGPGRPRKLPVNDTLSDTAFSMESDQKPTKKAGTHTLIYRPQDVGDANETEMAGIKFRANVPVEVADTVCILQLLREERETPDGIRSRAVERKVPLYQVVGANPWFEVDGVKPDRPTPLTKVPDTSDSYRGWAINWIAATNDAGTLQKRWVAEEGLRNRCGLTRTDINYILPFLDARKAECVSMDDRAA